MSTQERTFSGRSPETADLFGGDLEEPVEDLDDPMADPEPEPEPEPEVAETDTEETSAPESVPTTETDEPPEEEAVSDIAVSGEEPATGEVPSPTEPEPVDWEKRYADLRKEEMAALTRERELREQYEQILVEQRRAAPPAEIDVNALVAQAQAAGIDDPEQIKFFVALAQHTATQATAPLVAQQTEAAARQEAAQLARVEVQAEQAKAQFKSSHPDLVEEDETKMVKFLLDIGAAQQTPDGRTNVMGELTTDVLEIALEAARDPFFSDELLSSPERWETDAGIRVARAHARIAKLASEPTTPTTQTTPGRTTQDALAAVEAAETLGGPSAPAGAVEEQIFDRPPAENRFRR